MSRQDFSDTRNYQSDSSRGRKDGKTGPGKDHKD